MEQIDRRRKRIWGVGITVWVLLTAASAVEAVPRIENDLTRRVHAELESAGYPPDLDVHFSGQDGRLCGFDTVDQAARAEDLAEDLRGVHDARSSCNSTADRGVRPTTTTAAPTTSAPATTTTPPTTSPTTSAAPQAAFGVVDLSAVVTVGDNGIVTLSGIVADDDQHDGLVRGAEQAFGTGNVIDELEVADADSADTDAAVNGLVGLIQALPVQLASGEAGFANGELFLRGVAANDEALQALESAALAAGASRDTVELTSAADLASLQVRASLDRGLFTLSGVVAAETDRQVLLAAAAEASGGLENVIDTLTVDPSMSPDPAALRALGGLIAAMPPNLVTGEVSFDGVTATAKGVFVDETSRAAFEAAATRAGVAAADLTLEPRADASDQQAADLEDELNQLGAIPFAANSADLLPEADPIIARVAALAKQFGGVAIEIQGHTDSDGSPEGNQVLSERRASAVVEAIVALGVPAEQLDSVGFGESQPVAPNDTPENKALNRRVQFVVRKV
jgi:OOP family OmpA-OmpF porin